MRPGAKSLELSDGSRIADTTAITIAIRNVANKPDPRFPGADLAHP